MKNSASTFVGEGFVVVPDVLSQNDLDQISTQIQNTVGPASRTRRLLEQPWCQDLARKIRAHSKISALLPVGSVAVLSTYFPKSVGDNWKVGLHRDEFVPVQARTEVPGWGGWSEKEGMQFARPPRELLAKLFAIRVHLDASTFENGPLIVVPGSHQNSQREPRVPCIVPAGGVLVMSPLLLHASSKVVAGSRRVLHFLFGPNHLPNGLVWANAV